MSPARLVVVAFAVTILGGALLLTLPAMVRSGVRLNSFSDALFMSTSAVCVTGLGVRDLADWSFLGQLTLLLLIQAGGLGITTFAKLALLAGKRRLALGERALLDTTHGHLRWVSPRDVFRQGLAYTLGCELLGTLLLAPPFIRDHGWLDGLWAALFHAVSAFCNAGFSLWRDNLCQYREDWWVNAVMMALIVAGGLGFVVITDLLTWLRRRHAGLSTHFSLHTRTVIWTTLGLILGGWAVILVLAWFRGDGRVQDQVLPALFLSVTTRTAGFNTIGIATLSHPALLVVMVLMFIGGSPGSTAGGIKTTTFAVLIALVRSRARGRAETELFGRSVSFTVIGKALGTLGAMAAAVLIATMALEITENGLAPYGEARAFLPLLFEVVSALGTVGLTMDLTPRLSDSGRLVIDLCMFIGRLGPLLLATATLVRQLPERYTLPREDLLIG